MTLAKKYSRWTVVGEEPVGPPGNRKIECVCDCGTRREVSVGSLRHGGTKSCGCYRDERAAITSARHGLSRGGKITPTYRTWMLMNRRCNNPNSEEYRYYGAKGILICERWKVFENFREDMGERPEGKTIDRFPDNAGNYEPGNCRWATKREQALNRKTTVWVEHKGKRLCLKDWGKELGVHRETVRKRLDRGCDVEGNQITYG